MNSAKVWACGDYERVAERLAPVHDQLVARLQPRAGERWLDVATGTGAVAIRAAQAGAHVVGVDITPELLVQARAKSDGLLARFDLGDAQDLPYEDASFDVVASCFGAIFGPDQGAVAHELARVCRSGGRLGLTAWHANDELDGVYERAGVDVPALDPDPVLWSDEGHLVRLLGKSFELELVPGVWRVVMASPKAVWEWWSSVVPPFVALLNGLDPERREAFRREYTAFAERHRTQGGVELRRDYVLVLGRRR